MQPRRYLAVFAIPAMLAVLLVVGAPLAERQHSTSTPTGSNRHTIVAGEAPMAPTAVASTEQSRRNLAFGALVAYLTVATSVALALLLRIRGGVASWVVLPRRGLTRRERAPPFVLA